MDIKIKISLGELVDKITILQIKKEMIKDKSKIIKIEKELKHLEDILFSKFPKNKDLYEYLSNLKNINKKLWNIEDEIRKCEKLKNFDNNFIELARSVYITNDKRFEIKNSINNIFSSEIVEVKSYEKY